MPAHYSAVLYGFPSVAAFERRAITSVSGALLPGATDWAVGLIDRFAPCFVDHSGQTLIELVLPHAGGPATAGRRCRSIPHGDRPVARPAGVGLVWQT